jgi:hypothetical protein
MKVDDCRHVASGYDGTAKGELASTQRGQFGTMVIDASRGSVPLDWFHRNDIMLVRIRSRLRSCHFEFFYQGWLHADAVNNTP